jgi:hypothetical protein
MEVAIGIFSKYDRAKRPLAKLGYN